MSESKPKRKWIKSATADKGALHRHLGVPEGETIPEERLHEAARSKDKTIRKEANLALTLKGLSHGKKEAPKRRAIHQIRNALYGAKDS